MQVGQTSALHSEFYQPLNTRQYFFVAPRIDIERRPVNIFQGTTRIAQYDVRSYTASLDFGSQFTKYGEARIGVQAGAADASLSTGPVQLAPGPGHIRIGAITGRLFLDQLDSTSFPRSGYAGWLKLFASQPGLGADQAYVKGTIDGIYALSFGNNTFNLGFRAGSKIGDNPLPRYDLFQWGGFLQQSGYSTGQLLGENLQLRASSTTTSWCGRACWKGSMPACRWKRPRRRAAGAGQPHRVAQVCLDLPGARQPGGSALPRVRPRHRRRIQLLPVPREALLKRGRIAALPIVAQRPPSKVVFNVLVHGI